MIYALPTFRAVDAGLLFSKDKHMNSAARLRLPVVNYDQVESQQ